MRRAKYLLVSAFDVASVVVIVGGAWLALAEPAAAYVDPSVMTYTIQALAGVAVALSAVLGVVWRRARRWLLRALRIDENAGKVVEGDVSLISGATTPSAVASSRRPTTRPATSAAVRASSSRSTCPGARASCWPCSRVSRSAS